MNAETRRSALQLVGAGDSRFGRSYLLAAVRQQAGCTETEVMESLWGLVAEGLLYLDPSGQHSSTDNWQWRLSADGRRAASGGTWEPRDASGYLDRIRREIPDLDSLVELYLTEALGSFNGRCYLATSVMLGVAAEQAFLAMVRKYAASALAGAANMAKELDRPRNNYFTLWSEFRKKIEPIRHDLPEGLADLLTLDAIADLIRQTRNEVGHPTGRQVDEDTARVHLTIAPVYLQKMHLLSSYFTDSASR